MKNGTENHDFGASHILVPTEEYPTDEELVAGVKSSDDDKHLELLYQKYDKLAFCTAKLVLHNDLDARDAVQEFWTDKVRRLENFDPNKGCLLAWIKIGIKHHAIDKLRKKKGYEKLLNRKELENSMLVATPSDKYQTFYGESVIRETTSLMQEHQHLLPPSQLEVLLLFMQGFSQAEIADRIQAPINTVKTRYNLGIKKLRPIFERAFQKQYVSPRPKSVVTN